MIDVKELRVGNRVQQGEFHLTVLEIGKDKALCTDFNRGPGFCTYNNSNGIELTPEILDVYGFEELPHYTVQNLREKDIGRNRVLSIGCAGTPNEIIFLTEQEPPEVKDVIVLRNFDYDGKTYLHQLQNLYYALTGQELQCDIK